MATKATTRAVLWLAVTLALAGCYSVRHRHDGETATADGKPAPKGKKARDPREVLPPGLGGDTAHHAYTDAPR